MATTGHESEAINVQGLKASLQKLKTDHIDGKAAKSNTTAGSYNKVTVNSQGIVTAGENPTTLAGHGITDAYTKTEVNGLVDTPHQEYVTVQATSQTTAATDVLPNSGQAADTIYRVSNWDGSANSGAGAFDVTKYSEYAWDGVSVPGKYVFLCVKSQIGEVFDISVYNNNAVYANLSAALGANGANVPESLRKGGMSVKFIQGSVQSSDNKYVQYRYMSSSTAVADFTNVANWQGVDDEPTAGSDNFVDSKGINSSINNSVLLSFTKVRDVTTYEQMGYYNTENLAVGDIFNASDRWVSTAATTLTKFINGNARCDSNTYVCITGKNTAIKNSIYLFIDDTTKEVLEIRNNGTFENEIIKAPQDNCRIYFCHVLTGSTYPYALSLYNKTNEIQNETIAEHTEKINIISNNLGDAKELNLGTGYRILRELGIFYKGDVVNLYVPDTFNGSLSLTGNDPTSVAYIRTYVTLTANKKNAEVIIPDDNVILVLQSNVVTTCTIFTRTMANVDSLNRLYYAPESQELNSFITAQLKKGITNIYLKPYGSYNCIGHLFRYSDKLITIEGNNANIYAVDSEGNTVATKASNVYYTNIIVKNATIHNMYGVSGGFIELYNCTLNYNTGTAVGNYDNLNSLIGVNYHKSHFVLENIIIKSTVKEHFGISIRVYCEDVRVEGIEFECNMLYYFFRAENGLRNSRISNIIASDSIAGIQFTGRTSNVFENNVIENCNLKNIKEEAICFDCMGNERVTPYIADCSIIEISDYDIVLPTNVTIPAKKIKLAARKLNSDFSYRDLYLKNDDEPVIIDGQTVPSANVVGRYIISNNKARKFRIFDSTNDGTYSYIVVCDETDNILISESNVYDCVLVAGFHNNIIRNCCIEHSTTGISLWGACYGNIIEHCQSFNCRKSIDIVGFNANQNYYKLHSNDNIIFGCNVGKIKVSTYAPEGIDALINYRNKLLANVYETLVVNSQEDFKNYDS